MLFFGGHLLSSFVIIIIGAVLLSTILWRRKRSSSRRKGCQRHALKGDDGDNGDVAAPTNANAGGRATVKKVRRTQKDVAAVYDHGVRVGGVNVITRGLTQSSAELDALDREGTLNTRPYVTGPKTSTERVICYGCCGSMRSSHPVYLYSCLKCGNLFQRMRNLSRNLSGQIFLVVGCRTKMGHMVVLKLLRAGARVIGTTRRPQEAIDSFLAYPDGVSLVPRLTVRAFDADVANMEEAMQTLIKSLVEEGAFDVTDMASAEGAQRDDQRAFYESISSSSTASSSSSPPMGGGGRSRGTNPNPELVSDAIFDPVPRPGVYRKLDGLIYVAAQTIRSKEKFREETLSAVKERNRYGDAKYAADGISNSWSQTLMHCEQKEFEECMRINAIGPALLVKTLTPLLSNCPPTAPPFVIFVHAREGLFKPHKACIHPQTNMAKAALHMLTRTLQTDGDLSTRFGNRRFRIFGVDPGWISVDEYFEHKRPFIVAPLDEVDGAARILFPIFSNAAYGCSVTTRHFYQNIV